MDDLSLIISSLGSTDANDADLNNDGAVGLDDLGMFLNVLTQ